MHYWEMIQIYVMNHMLIIRIHYETGIQKWKRQWRTASITGAETTEEMIISRRVKMLK